MLNQSEDELYARLDRLLAESQLGVAAPRRGESHGFVSKLLKSLKKQAPYLETPTSVTAAALLADLSEMLRPYGFPAEKYHLILIVVCTIMIKTVFKTVREL